MVRLAVDLVPRSCWFSNVRSEVPKATWDALREQVYIDADYHCYYCDRAVRRGKLHCHEVWEYDVTGPKPIQRLSEMVALCNLCHEVKHFGKAELDGHGERAFRHLMKINGWSEDRAVQHLLKKKVQWEERSRLKWKLNLSALDRYGVVVPTDRRKT